MVDVAQLAIRVDSSDVSASAVSLDKMGTAAGKATKETDNLSKAGKKNSFEMRRAAMQLSQVAQQGAVTGNYFQALAIQLPDLVLGLGSFGIIAGAVAGSLAGPLINALSSSSKGVDELNEITTELSKTFTDASDGSYKFSEELVRLARVSEEIARLKVTSGIEDARRSILGIGEALADTYSGIKNTLSLTVEESNRLSEAVSSAVQSKDISDYDALAGVIADLESKYQSATNAARENLLALREAGSSNVIDRKRIQEASDEYLRLRNSLNGIRGEFTDLIQSGAESALVFDRLTKSGANFDDMLKRSTQDLDALQTAIPKTSYSLSDWFAEQNEQTRKQLEEREKMVEAAQSRFAQMMSRDAMAVMNPDQQAAQMLGQTMQQYQQMLDDRLISDEQYLAAKEAAETRYYERIKEIREQDKKQQFGLNEATLNGASQMFGNLAEIAKAGGKDSFEAWKRMAQAQALVNVAMGVTNALATVPAPLNFAVAGTIAALGAVQVAQIEQQQYQAREYGGQVKAGSSYLVGERGPEMITMGGNGNVTPSSSLGSSGNTTVVLQVSTGVQSTVRAEMASMMPMIAKTVQRVVGAQRR